MKQTAVQKIAKLLKWLVLLTLLCNLVALPLVPKLVSGLRGVGPAYSVVLSAFLIFCGCCTAVVLWQGRRVLNTVLRGEPFAAENAVSLKRAAICAFLISGAALARLIWGLLYFRSVAPLTSYNALFVPVFAMAGLLALVMSALFRQAAELKAENDLTI